MLSFSGVIAKIGRRKLHVQFKRLLKLPLSAVQVIPSQQFSIGTFIN